MSTVDEPTPRIPQQRPGVHYDHPDTRLDRVTLMSHAMWSLAAEKMQLTDADLKARMTELDMADGARDRKVTVAPKRCACGSMVSPKPGWCMGCGEPVDFSPFVGV